ncbi:hypothetical protein [Billgrantia diversa]|uniref:hypothetical protein n=1 Tax=Halomonas sp. MCCC 1A13316 TaxID=2733487 RepID=UPI0018D33B33|nr:hypothetical protein [Halomonas sp. MCCC 1A13316]
MNQMSKKTLKEFTDEFEGSVIIPYDPNYDEVRQIWNAMIDRRPSMTARCVSPEDVVKSLRGGARRMDVSTMGHECWLAER